MNTYEHMKFSPQGKKRRGSYFICETCGKEFYRMPCHTKGKNVRYCSMACYDKTGENNPFHGKKHSEDSLRKMKEHPNRNSFRTGEDNPNFTRFGEDYESKSRDAIRTRQRDAVGSCQRCGFPDTRILQIHHTDRDNKNNAPTNLEVLCPNCHALHHYLTQTGTFHGLREVKECFA